MTLLQQLIPMPIPVPVDSHSSGPWTHEDTKVAITIWIVIFLWWLVSILVERIFAKTSFKDILLMDYETEFIMTTLSTMVFYVVSGLCLFVFVGSIIYKLL